MRKEKTVVNHNLLISIACNEDPKVANLTKSGQRSLIDRFMKIHRLSLRTFTTTTGGTQEQVSDDELRSAESFKSEFREIVLAHQIPPECIFNMDQSGLYYEVLPKKTIDIIGSKQSAVATRGGTKKRVTIISLISCAGELVKQYVIFKGTAGGRIEAYLQAFNDDNTCFGAQEKAWTDKVELRRWINVVWEPIARRTNGPKLLIIDSYPLHKELKEEFKIYNTQILFVSEGLTWQLQPLDSLFHKRYKKLAQDYFLFHQKDQFDTEEQKRFYMINCVKDIVSKINSTTIRASWEKVGLGYQGMDVGSEMMDVLDEGGMLIVPDQEVNDTMEEEFSLIPEQNSINEESSLMLIENDY